jgi:hypothetical protein
MRPLLRAAHSEGCWLRGRVELHARCAAWAVLGCARGAAGGAPSFEEAAACAVVVVSAVRRLARVARAAERVAGGVVRAARRRATRRRRVREAHADAAGRCSARAPSTPCASARRHAGGPKRAHRGGREPIFGASSQVVYDLPVPAAIQAELTIQAKGRREKPRRALSARCARAATPPARSGPWSPPFPHFSPGMHGILTALRRAEAAARERRRPGPANGTSPAHHGAATPALFSGRASGCRALSLTCAQVRSFRQQKSFGARRQAAPGPAAERPVHARRAQPGAFLSAAAARPP